MKMPKLPENVRKYTQEISAFRGINYTDNYVDGELAESKNISSMRYPYMTVRRVRSLPQLEPYKHRGGIRITKYCHEKEIWQTKEDSEPYGVLPAYSKYSIFKAFDHCGNPGYAVDQIVAVNNYIVLWMRNKGNNKLKYLDFEAGTIKDLEAEAEASGATFTADTITVSGTDLTTLFKPGDGLTVSGCAAEPGNNKVFIVKSVTATVLTATENAFTAASEAGAVTISRKLPNMSFVCESGNRLWGCGKDGKTIYASALGDPTNFDVFQGLSTDSWRATIGHGGEFTACTSFNGAVLFWMRNKLFRVVGDYPAEYAIYEKYYPGCISNNSQVVVGDTLIYQGAFGIYSYTGSNPTNIATALGEKDYRNGVAVADERYYYICVEYLPWDFRDYPPTRTEKKLFVYDTKTGIWVREDELDVVSADYLGVLNGQMGCIHLVDGEGQSWSVWPYVPPLFPSETTWEYAGATPFYYEEWYEIEWYAQFKPFYETVDGRKVHSKLFIRAELPKGAVIEDEPPLSAWMVAEVRCDNGRWIKAGEIRGPANDTYVMPLVIDRCDKFELKLSGKGPFLLKSILREFTVGGEQ